MNTFPQRPATRPIAGLQRGSTLLEVLVSVLIFSFGILGLVAMQVRATQFSVDAEDRNRAALLADDLAAQMRLARTVTLPTAQLTAWQNRLGDPTGQGMPNGTATITVTGNTALIVISWRPPRQALGQESRLTTEVVLTTEEVT